VTITDQRLAEHRQVHGIVFDGGDIHGNARVAQ
jgi:hypothetical protein